MYVDSHAHLDDKAFDADREQVIERARAAGVGLMVAIGGGDGPDDLACSLPFAEKHSDIYATVGIHPHVAAKAEACHFDALLAAATLPKVLAVGEIGLDYFYDHSPREVQQQVFARQLEVARQVQRPIVIHCRDAWPDLTRLIESHWKSSGLGGVLHCFGGTREDAFRYLDWGFVISFAGNVTFKRAENLRAVAREIPLDRLLTETDAPYLAPVPHRGDRNEPAFVVETANALAALRGLEPAEFAAQTVANFHRFFRLP